MRSNTYARIVLRIKGDREREDDEPIDEPSNDTWQIIDPNREAKIQMHIAEVELHLLEHPEDVVKLGRPEF